MNITIANGEVKISLSKSDIFDSVKLFSARRAAMLTDKNGADISDTYTFTGDEDAFRQLILTPAAAYISQAFAKTDAPAKVDISGDNVDITISYDSKREGAVNDKSVANIADIILRLVEEACISKWYEAVSKSDWEQEYMSLIATDLQSLIPLFSDFGKKSVISQFPVF